MWQQIISLLFIILLLIPSCGSLPVEKYKIRKGGRIDRMHRRMLHKWRKAYMKRDHNRTSSDDSDGIFPLDHVLDKMDSFIRPRFG